MHTKTDTIDGKTVTICHFSTLAEEKAVAEQLLTDIEARLLAQTDATNAMACPECLLHVASKVFISSFKHAAAICLANGVSERVIGQLVLQQLYDVSPRIEKVEAIGRDLAPNFTPHREDPLVSLLAMIFGSDSVMVLDEDPTDDIHPDK